MKKVFALTLVVLTVLSLAACATTPAAPAAAPATAVPAAPAEAAPATVAPAADAAAAPAAVDVPKPPSKKVAWVASNIANEFTTGMAANAVSVGKENGWEVTVFNPDTDLSKQISQIENAATQGYAAIIFDPVAFDGMTAVVDSVMSNYKIPVITLHGSASAQDKLTAYVAVDLAKGGELKMEQVAKDLNGKGNIAIMTGTEGQTSALLVTSGYDRVLPKYPDIKVVFKAAGSWNADSATPLAENWLSSGKSLDAIVCNNDGMALGVKAVLQSAGMTGKIKLYGLDATPEGRKSVRDGSMNASIWIDSHAEFVEAFKIINAFYEGKPFEKEVLVSPSLVTKDNVDQLFPDDADAAAAAAPAVVDVPKPPSKKVAWVASNIANEFTTGMAANAVSVGKENGWEVTVFNPDTDLSKQISQIENAATQGYAAIIFDPVAFDGMTAVVDNVMSNYKIPVITLHGSASAQDKLTAYVAVDLAKGGELKMEQVAKDLNGKGNIAIMTGTEGQTSALLVTSGYDRVLPKYPDIKVVFKAAGSWNADSATPLAENWLSSGKSLDAIVCNNDGMALGVKAVLQSAGMTGKIKLYGLDATPEGRKSVRDGSMNASIWIDSHAEFVEAFKIINAFYEGKPFEKEVLVSPSLVTKDNVDQLFPDDK